MGLMGEAGKLHRPLAHVNPPTHTRGLNACPGAGVVGVTHSTSCFAGPRRACFILESTYASTPPARSSSLRLA